MHGRQTAESRARGRELTLGRPKTTFLGSASLPFLPLIWVELECRVLECADRPLRPLGGKSASTLGTHPWSSWEHRGCWAAEQLRGDLRRDPLAA